MNVNAVACMSNPSCDERANVFYFKNIGVWGDNPTPKGGDRHGGAWRPPDSDITMKFGVRLGRQREQNAPGISSGFGYAIPTMHPDGYFALVLEPASAAMLRHSFATLAHPIGHHCTVRYGTNRLTDLPAPFGGRDIGKTFQMKIIGYARAENKVEAVVVALVLPDGTLLERGFSENVIPHITVATDGVEEPARANDLLEAGFARIDGPTLDAKLEHTYASSKSAA